MEEVNHNQVKNNKQTQDTLESRVQHNKVPPIF